MARVKTEISIPMIADEEKSSFFQTATSKPQFSTASRVSRTVSGAARNTHTDSTPTQAKSQSRQIRMTDMMKNPQWQRANGAAPKEKS
jgi:hypothetical protein